jgi:hypothetical protein
MSRSCARKLAAILGFVLAAMGGRAWAQELEQPPLSLTGRILFGYGDLSEGHSSDSGPSATLETILSGYWRDPRILQFSVKPMVTLGEAVPGTEMGNAMTGFSGVGIILQGSSFPLTLSYSRSGSSFGEDYRSSVANPGQDVLSGAETKITSSVFAANWLLRFKHLPTVDLNYKDTDFSAGLPQAFGGGEYHDARDFSAHINYNVWGWQLASRYQHSQVTTTAPDILTGGVQADNSTTSDIGFGASRLLPLHSTLAMNVDQTESEFNFDGSETNFSARSANASLTAQPVPRLSTSLQALYTSNLQASEVQQALAGAGVPGIGGSPASPGPTPASTVSPTYLAAPYTMLSLSGGVGLRLGHGFSLNGAVGESHTSPYSGTSTEWSAGLGYNHKWRSGWLSTSYSHSDTSTQVEVVGANATAGAGNTTQSTAPYSLFFQDTDVDTGTVNLSQYLPHQFKLATSAHVSEGTIKDDGIPYPYHDYGGLASLTRPVGQWTLTGGFTLDEMAANQPLIYNQNKTESVFLGAGSRGLNLSAGYQYGSGLALQMGTGLIFVNNPQIFNPVLGTAVPSSTSGTTLTGSYRSRKGRFMLQGYLYHFNYTTDHLPATEFNMFNLHGSYKLRRLRLIAGYMKQTQMLGVNPSGYETRLMFFQVERVFRLY